MLCVNSYTGDARADALFYNILSRQSASRAPARGGQTYNAEHGAGWQKKKEEKKAENGISRIRARVAARVDTS